MKNMFHIFAHQCSEWLGTAWAFIVAILVIFGWLLSGPYYQYSDTWQLIINTSTTIVTFLMVFIIQNTQNRDARAIHLKLDELLRSIEKARNNLVSLEDMTEEQIEDLKKEFDGIRQKCDDSNRKKAAPLAG